MDNTIIWPATASLAEGPLWHPEQQRLYWIDIIEGQVHGLDWKTQAHYEWQLPGHPGTIARSEDGLLVALQQSIAELNTESGEIRALEHPISDPYLRFNDGKCDPRGRFWVSTAPFNTTEFKPNGYLGYFSQGEYHRVLDEVVLGNGLGWTHDHKQFYFTDSPRREIYRFDYNIDSGEITNRQLFAKLGNDDGYPDGLCIDSDGCVWSAIYAGSRIIRFDPDGKVERELAMPVSKPTCVAFAGDDLDVMVVTSCALDFNQPASERLADPAGSVFAITFNDTIRGFTEPVYGG